MAKKFDYSCAMDRVTGVQLFIRVVETGSFSKAASEFGVTQPTATKAVAAMELRLVRGCCTARRAAWHPPRSAPFTTTSAK